MSQRLRAALASRLIGLSAVLDRTIELSKVDLGETREPWDYPCAIGTKASTTKKKWYPSMSIYHTKAKLDIPDSGKATVDYRVVRRTERVDGDDQKTHDYEIEIQSIEPEGEQKKDAATKKEGKAVALSALRPGMIRFDARARNGQGEYAATDGGTITPNQASAAYGHPEEREVISPAAGRLTGQALLRRAMRR